MDNIASFKFVFARWYIQCTVYAFLRVCCATNIYFSLEVNFLIVYGCLHSFAFIYLSYPDISAIVLLEGLMKVSDVLKECDFWI
jgi:hypothetical protein